MQAKDFRLGNLIQIEEKVYAIGKIEEKTFSFVVGESSEHGKIWNPHIPFSDSRVKGVELTDEWFRIMNFTLVVNDGKYFSYVLPNNPTAYIAQTPEGFYFVIENEDEDAGEGEVFIKIDIKYVHQVQNLFHILAGQEIELY